MPIAQSEWPTAFGLRGDNPKKLPEINIDPTKIQADTLRGNLQNLPRAEELAAQIDEFNQAQLLKNLERMMPGYTRGRDIVTQNLTQLAQGRVPKDVERYLWDLS